MSSALSYGSFGDLVETARLAVKIVRILRDGGKMSRERLALAADLQTLNSDLIILECVASGVTLDSSCTRSLSVLLRIRSEVDSCRAILAQFLEHLSVPRGILGNIFLAVVEENELAKFRGLISVPLNNIHTLILTLNLVTSQGVGMQLKDIGSRVESLGTQFDQFLTSCQETVSQLPIPRGVSDDIFCVIDPVGGNIPISLRYCRVYDDLDRIIKAHLPIHRLEAGSRYVHRGDYSIVSCEGCIISPMEFPGTVRAGLQVEMSILKRQVQNRQDAVQNTQCPHCHRNNADETGNDWYKWWLVIFTHNSRLIH
ncbi:hypothetical protein B0H13DRAFT_961240 [Mycena leptocephala]|nr:hypothetical protein B0H13DRAFT_961240 [Mycena leptocephala]